MIEDSIGLQNVIVFLVFVLILFCLLVCSRFFLLVGGFRVLLGFFYFVSLSFGSEGGMLMFWVLLENGIV